MQLFKSFKKRLNKEKGQSIVEYALILGIFASVFIYIGFEAIQLIQSNYRTSMSPYSMEAEVPEPIDTGLPSFSESKELIAVIGGDQYIRSNETTTFLDLSTSSSPIVSSQWEIKQGNTVVYTGEGNSIDFVPTALTSTSYLVTLTVTNEDGDTKTTSVTVNLTQNPPKAVINFSEESMIINPNLSGSLTSLRNLSGYYPGDAIQVDGYYSYDTDGEDIATYKFELEGVSGSLLGFRDETSETPIGRWALDDKFADKSGVVKVTLTVKDTLGNYSEPVESYFAYNVTAENKNPANNNFYPEILDVQINVNNDTFCFVNPKGKDTEDGNIITKGNFFVKADSGKKSLSDQDCYTISGGGKLVEVTVKDSIGNESKPLYVHLTPKSNPRMVGVNQNYIIPLDPSNYYIRAKFMAEQLYITPTSANKYKYSIYGLKNDSYDKLLEKVEYGNVVLDLDPTQLSSKYFSLYIYYNLEQAGTEGQRATDIYGYYMYKSKY